MQTSTARTDFQRYACDLGAGRAAAPLEHRRLGCRRDRAVDVRRHGADRAETRRYQRRRPDARTTRRRVDPADHPAGIVGSNPLWRVHRPVADLEFGAHQPAAGAHAQRTAGSNDVPDPPRSRRVSAQPPRARLLAGAVVDLGVGTTMGARTRPPASGNAPHGVRQQLRAATDLSVVHRGRDRKTGHDSLGPERFVVALGARGGHSAQSGGQSQIRSGRAVPRDDERVRQSLGGCAVGVRVSGYQPIHRLPNAARSAADSAGRAAADVLRQRCAFRVSTERVGPLSAHAKRVERSSRFSSPRCNAASAGFMRPRGRR